MKWKRAYSGIAAAAIVAALGFTIASCGGGGGGGTPPPPPTLTVRVVNDDFNDVRIAGATVVLGNPDGTVAATGTTDSKGEVIFTNPPANALVTATTSGDDPDAPARTLYSLRTVYDVNVPAVTLTLEKRPPRSGLLLLTQRLTRRLCLLGRIPGHEDGTHITNNPTTRYLPGRYPE